MASRLNMMKMLHEMRGFADIAERPARRPALLLMMELRSRARRKALSRPRMFIPVNDKQGVDIPDPVKISVT